MKNGMEWIEKLECVRDYFIRGGGRRGLDYFSRNGVGWKGFLWEYLVRRIKGVWVVMGCGWLGWGKCSIIDRAWFGGNFKWNRYEGGFGVKALSLIFGNVMWYLRGVLKKIGMSLEFKENLLKYEFENY